GPARRSALERLPAEAAERRQHRDRGREHEAGHRAVEPGEERPAADAAEPRSGGAWEGPARPSPCATGHAASAATTVTPSASGIITRTAVRIVRPAAPGSAGGTCAAAPGI